MLNEHFPSLCFKVFNIKSHFWLAVQNILLFIKKIYLFTFTFQLDARSSDATSNKSMYA